MAQADHLHQESEQKWEGKAYAKLTGPKPGQVWPLLEDYLNIHKWLPGIDTCHLVEGPLGQPGCVRYCSRTTILSPNDITGEGEGEGEATTMTVSWAKEKLLSIDPISRCISYEVIDGNIGFNSYIATLTVLPSREDEDEDDDQDGCKIEWLFTVDPIQGWKLEDLVTFIDSILQVMAKRMEEAINEAK